jgi:hypothetical protein
LALKNQAVMPLTNAIKHTHMRQCSMVHGWSVQLGQTCLVIFAIMGNDEDQDGYEVGTCIFSSRRWLRLNCPRAHSRSKGIEETWQERETVLGRPPLSPSSAAEITQIHYLGILSEGMDAILTSIARIDQS